MAELKPLLDQYYEKARQHQKILLWSSVAFVFALIVLFLIYYLVQIYPVNQVSQFGINNVSEKADLINKYRTTSIQFIATFAQILSGIAIGIGIYFAWKNITVAQDTFKFNQKNAQDNLKVAQEGQITERFTRAIDQLGNLNLEIRLGGIYALERISKESEDDYWPIMEILTAYVRMNASTEKIENKKLTQLNIDVKANESAKSEISEAQKVSLDIQAILTVIGKREKTFFDNEKHIPLYLQGTFIEKIDLTQYHLEDAECSENAFLAAFEMREKTFFNNEKYTCLNLQGTCLKKADLRQSHLEDANLQMAHLEDAKLEGAHLERANFREAHLERAYFWFAHLERSSFIEAHLQEAYFFGAHLEGAHFDEAHLQGAHFFGAHLEGAYFFRAHLEGADFSGAHLQGADFMGAHLEGADFSGDHLEGAEFMGAHLEGADFSHAHLEEARYLSFDELSKVKTLYGTKLDDELKIELMEKYPALFEEPKL